MGCELGYMVHNHLMYDPISRAHVPFLIHKSKDINDKYFPGFFWIRSERNAWSICVKGALL